MGQSVHKDLRAVRMGLRIAEELHDKDSVNDGGTTECDLRDAALADAFHSMQAIEKWAAEQLPAEGEAEDGSED